MDVKKIAGIPLIFKQKDNYSGVPKSILSSYLDLNDSVLVKPKAGITLGIYHFSIINDFTLDFNNYNFFTKNSDNTLNKINKSEFVRFYLLENEVRLELVNSKLSLEELYFRRKPNSSNLLNVYYINNELPLSTTYKKIIDNNIVSVSLLRANFLFNYRNLSIPIPRFNISQTAPLLSSQYFPVRRDDYFHIIYIKWDGEKYVDVDGNVVNHKNVSLYSTFYDVYLNHEKTLALRLTENGTVKTIIDVQYPLSDLTFVKPDKYEINERLKEDIIELEYDGDFEDQDTLEVSNNYCIFSINHDQWEVKYENIYNITVSDGLMKPSNPVIKVEQCDENIPSNTEYVLPQDFVESYFNNSHTYTTFKKPPKKLKVVEKPVRISQCRDGQIIEAFKDLSNLISKGNRYHIRKGSIQDDQGYPFSTKDQIFYKLVPDE